MVVSVSPKTSSSARSRRSKRYPAL
jgi:hypothetical protein